MFTESLLFISFIFNSQLIIQANRQTSLCNLAYFSVLLSISLECLSVCLPGRVSVSMFFCLAVTLYTCLSVCLSVLIYDHRSVYLPVLMHLCLIINMSVSLYIFVCIPVGVSVVLSVCSHYQCFYLPKHVFIQFVQY